MIGFFHKNHKTVVKGIIVMMIFTFLLSIFAQAVFFLR